MENLSQIIYQTWKFTWILSHIHMIIWMLILVRISMLTFMKCIQDFNLVTIIVNHNHYYCGWFFIVRRISENWSYWRENFNRTEDKKVIQPPYDFTFLNTKSRKTAIWLTNTLHQIFWNDGENSFSQTRKYLRTITSGKQIICKGMENKWFLQTFFGSRQLNNIGEMGLPS